MTKHEASAYNRLRRLQELSRSNMPAVMAQRATSTFTLHDEPPPQNATARVLVVVYPQDPFMGEPEVRTMDAADIRPGLVNSRIRIQGDVSVMPDEEGNYLYWVGTSEFDQVNAFYYTTFTLRMFERYAQRALPWAFPMPRITVDITLDDAMNAFYSEKDRMLGFHSFQVNGRRISTAQSADIVSHETAHAILDGLRDLYNESFGLGATAFHESFGDMAAMLVALHDDSLIRRLLDWTDGDLHRDNFVASVAEHLIQALKDDQITADEQVVYLRNAINSLAILPFEELLYQPPDPEFTLGRQPHNYSRVFTGAFYDIFAGIYNHLKQHTPAHIAIYRARDIVAYLLVCAVELGPVGELDFADMAKAFLAAENVYYDRRYNHVLVDVFDQRQILTRADAAAFMRELDTLPEVYLPDSINSALAAALFLEEKVLPALKLDDVAPLMPLAAYRNASGDAYLTYYYAERMALQGEQFLEFDGASVDLYGGLSLMFDKHNKLRSVIYRPITSTDRKQINILVAELIAFGLITQDYDADPTKLKHVTPQALMVTEPPSAAGSKNTHVLKFPVIFDPVSMPHLSLLEYFKRIKSILKRRT
ncbi:MAG: hypothetical protein D6711_00060 [Chloroflexi bacterium]|nr:MAG: hypothetical protein D6711_00060 [Chloroflexota bacterium]